MALTKEEIKRREELLQQGLKICSKCKRILSVKCFSKNKNYKDGMTTRCKECAGYDNKQYYDKHSDQMREKTRKYIAENQEKVKEYYDTHKEERRAYQSQYNKKNAERLNQQRKDRGYDKSYYQKHRIELLERQSKYRELHRDDIAEYKKEYQQTNKAHVRDWKQKYYCENIEHILEEKREYYIDNRAVLLRKAKLYRNTERGKITLKKALHKRRLILKSVGGDYSFEDIQEMLLFFNYKCAYTGEPLEEHYHLDHIVPLSKYGSNYIWNIVPSNSHANLSKNARDMEGWYRQQSYFSEERLQKIYEWINLQKNLKEKKYMKPKRTVNTVFFI